MASYEQMGPRKYRAVWRDAAGKKCHSKAPYFETARSAKLYAGEQEAKARRQVSRDSGTLLPSITWGEWCETWWATRDIELTTHHSEGSVRDAYLVPRWGELPMNGISRKDVRAWLNELVVEGTAARAVRIYGVFRASMAAAVEEGLLDGTPCAGVPLPTVPKPPTEYFEDQEFAKLLPAMNMVNIRYGELCELVRDTGMRPGEVGGLHWSEVDLNGGYLYVSKVLLRPGYEIKEFPKGKRGRELPLTRRCVEILSKWREEVPPKKGCGRPHVVKRAVSRRACSSDLVFRQPNGNPLNLNNVDPIFHRALDRASLRHRPFYALRHTFATRLAEAGVDVYEIARLMGHAKLEQSMVYVHRTQSARGRVLAALGDPEASRLRAVGQPGTETGTDARHTVSPGDTTVRDENIG